MNNETKQKVKNVIWQAIDVAVERGPDVDTEDGAFATTGVDSLINLETGIRDLLIAFDAEICGGCELSDILDELLEIKPAVRVDE